MGTGDTRKEPRDRPVPPDATPAADAALRSSGLRSTSARRAVLEVLAGTADHLDADALIARVTPRAPGAHRATVYRALSTLTDHGLVSHTHLPGGATVYHLGGQGSAPHAHLQCHVCGRVTDVPAALLAELGDVVERRYGFRLDATHGALPGRCASCRGQVAPGR